MNTRPVEDQLINRAIRDGYGGFPTGLHPALFLYMEVEPALVDVNVHPAKKEVRFRRSADVVNTCLLYTSPPPGTRLAPNVELKTRGLLRFLLR